MSTTPAPLTEGDWGLRAMIYRTFAEELRAPTGAELAAGLGSSEAEVRAAVDRLYAHHQIAPLPDGSGIWMANPFSAVPTDYPVEVPGGRVWANCAWDAFGVPAILGVDARLQMRCAQSGEPLDVAVRGGRLEGDPGVVHLVVPPRDAWKDIGFT